MYAATQSTGQFGCVRLRRIEYGLEVSVGDGGNAGGGVLADASAVTNMRANRQADSKLVDL